MRPCFNTYVQDGMHMQNAQNFWFVLFCFALFLMALMCNFFLLTARCVT